MTFYYDSGQSSVHPEWNFYKYLVDHNGRVVKGWSTKSTIVDIFDDIKRAVDAIPTETQESVVEEQVVIKDEL